jgi:hypothetical protein
MAARSEANIRSGAAGGRAVAGQPRRGFETWIRRAFFSHGAWLAGRYGLGPEDLIAQSAASPMPPALGVPRRAEGIEDLLVATACCRNHPQAWIDAGEMLEPLLVRAARMRLAESDAIVFARRFWATLRERTLDRAAGGSGGDGPAMQDYPPNRPLRNWLVDRLTGSMESAMRADRLPQGRRLALETSDRLRRPLQLADSGT